MNMATKYGTLDEASGTIKAIKSDDAFALGEPIAAVLFQLVQCYLFGSLQDVTIRDAAEDICS